MCKATDTSKKKVAGKMCAYAWIKAEEKRII